jgi:ABC-type branched-subunit amino acid transport system substrate-binding protein
VRKQLRIAVALVAALGLVAAAAAQSSRQASTTINIAWVGDKTGATAASQLPSLHGIETAFAYVNAHGGIGPNHDQINLIEKDDSYNPTTELSLVKSVISDSHVPMVMGLAQSTGFASVLPVLDQSQVVGFSTQTALKPSSSPFNPWVFAGFCGYADQVDVGIAYEMKHLRLKSLAGLNVGVAAIQSGSGREVIDEATRIITKYGGHVVVENLPATLVSADVQVQDLASQHVKFMVLHHAASGDAVFLRAMDKFNLTVPIIGMQGVTDATVFSTAPYDVIKDAVGMQCVDPPYLAKTPQAKLVTSTAQQYGFAGGLDLQINSFTSGWANGMIVMQALKNANGNYTAAGIKKGLEMIKNYDPTGGLTPPISYATKCHLGFPNPRPYLWNFKTKRFQPVGTWKQWAPYDTKPFAPPGTCGVPRGTKS